MTQFNRIKSVRDSLIRDWIYAAGILGSSFFGIKYLLSVTNWCQYYLYVYAVLLSVILSLMFFGLSYITSLVFDDEKKIIYLTRIDPISKKEKVSELTYLKLQFENRIVRSSSKFIQFYYDEKSIEGFSLETFGKDQYRAIIEKLESIGAEWLNKGYLKVD